MRMAGRVWGSLCTLTYLFLLARHLSPSGFGELTFYLAVFMVLDSLVDLGTGQVVVQWTANDPSRLRAVLKTARRQRILIGSAGAVLVGAGSWLLGEEGAIWIFLASLYPITHALELTTTAFKNRIRWSKPVTIRALAAGLSLYFVVTLIALGVTTPAPYLAAVALGSTLGNVLLHLVALPELPPESGSEPAVHGLFMAALPLGAAGLFQQLYFWVDNLFVRFVEGQQAVGQYNLAVRLMSFAIMAAVYTTAVALPWLTREFKAGRLADATGRILVPMLGLGGFVSGVIWPIRTELLGLFGTQGEFEAASPSLQWLLGAILAIYAGAPLVTAVLASGATAKIMRGALLGLVVNLVGNWILVPRYGIEGAAAATLLTELTVTLYAARTLLGSGLSPLGGRARWLWLVWIPGFLAGWVLGSWLPGLIAT